jgi:hypothetical protein
MPAAPIAPVAPAAPVTPAAAPPAKAPRLAAPAIVSQAIPAVRPAPVAPAPRPPAALPAPRPASPDPAAAAVAKAAAGPFWVQVGAFKDPEAARRLAARLRQENYRVEDPVRAGAASAAPPEAPGPDRYEVFVGGGRLEEIAGLLTGKTAKPEPVAGGVVVRPPLPLADALTLSRDLAGEGRRVQVRRAGGAVVAAPAGETFYRVRVGAFADRAAADAVRRELAGKGYRPFVARADQ